MADKPTRKIRPAQTVREKSVAAKDVKPSKRRHLGRFTKVIVSPFSKANAFLGRYKIFKIIGRILLPYYFRSSWAEIKQVTWPSRRETRRLTMAVIGFAVVFGTLVATLDYGLSRLFKIIILGNHH